MDRFTLDQNATRTWLTDLIEGGAPRIALHELHPQWTLAGSPSDEPWQASETVATLVMAAQHYGFLSEPSGSQATVNTFAEDRYSLTIEVPYGDKSQSFKLRSPAAPYIGTLTEDFSPNITLGAYGNPDPRGVDAAVDILRRARLLINRILDDFDSWSAGRHS